MQNQPLKWVKMEWVDQEQNGDQEAKEESTK